jgi:hypothetical protein
MIYLFVQITLLRHYDNLVMFIWFPIAFHIGINLLFFSDSMEDLFWSILVWKLHRRSKNHPSICEREEGHWTFFSTSKNKKNKKKKRKTKRKRKRKWDKANKLLGRRRDHYFQTSERELKQSVVDSIGLENNLFTCNLKIPTLVF